MKRYVVELTHQERDELGAMTRTGSHPSPRVINAWVVLTCDEGEFHARQVTGEAIAERLRISLRRVDCVTRRVVEDGMEAARGGRQGRRSSDERKPAGAFEAPWVARSGSEPPGGPAPWWLRWRADRVVAWGDIDRVSHETSRRVLKKTPSSRGGASVG